MVQFNIYQATILKGGTPCERISLETFDFSKINSNVKKEQFPIIQPFDSGIRIDGSNIDDYKPWNLCTLADLDIKHYKRNGEYFFAYPDEKDKTIWHFVSEERKQLFYKFYEEFYTELYMLYEGAFFTQQSFSEAGFHSILKFKGSRNTLNFKKACAYSIQLIKRVAKYLGPAAEEVINYPDVLDTCTKRIGQGIFLTHFEPHFNEFRGHEIGLVDLDDLDIEIEEEEFEQNEIIFHSNKKARISSKLQPLPGGYEYTNTRRLMWVVFKYFDFDKDKCNDVWKRFIPEILRERGKEKNERKLWAEFHQAWKNHQGKNYPFKGDILEWARINFGFKYKVKKEFKGKTFETYKPDIVYQLGPDQRLSDIDIKWSTKKINHLWAGCGYGKTFMGKKYGDTISNETDMDWIFNNRFFEKGVCFITPMKSINRDNFKDIKGWVIIDSDSKEDIIEGYGSIEECINKNQNICTTWESFVIRKMYNLPFKYVIVDEVHTFYMYDYRIKSITDIKKCLSYSPAIKILMTGTPSYEVEEFDCYKIKVEKEMPKVNANIVFYNEQYTGYIVDDIKKWIKDKNHYALIFKDDSNYKDEEKLWLYYGLKVCMFNRRYDENTEYILTEHTVKEQITMFSVYGQAGINLYLENKKVRIYILNNIGLSIIQYANRVRNKECIDKIIIPLSVKSIKNIYKPIKKRDITEAYSELDNKVNNINKLKKPVDYYEVITTKSDDILKLRYGIPVDCVEALGNKISLVESYSDTYTKIECVLKYEKQTQVIYNRLIENNFNVTCEILENDVPDNKNTKMKCGNFARSIRNFNWDLLKKYGSNYKINTDVDKDSKKIFNDNVIANLNDIFKYLINETGNFDDMKVMYNDIIGRYIKENNTITAKNLSEIRDMLYYKSEWANLYNNAILYMLVNKDTDPVILTAAYMRSKYSEDIEWSHFVNICDEAYLKIKELGKTFDMFKDMFEDKGFDKENYVCDDITQKICTELVNKHTRGGIKNIVIDGVSYKSVTDAAKQLGVTRATIYKKLSKQ